MKYKHIVFDIDGTLIDTEYAVLHSLQETIKGLSGREITCSELRFALGITGTDALKKLAIKDTSYAIELWDKNMRNYTNNIKVFDGIVELLKNLLSLDYEMGIVTSKTREEFTHDFCPFGISHYFKTIICADDTQEHKPNAAPILKYVELSKTDHRTTAPQNGEENIDKQEGYVEYKLQDYYCILDEGKIIYKTRLTKLQKELLENGGMKWIPSGNKKELVQVDKICVPMEIENVGNGTAVRLRYGLNRKNIEIKDRKYLPVISLKTFCPIVFHIFSEDCSKQSANLGDYVLSFYYEDMYSNKYQQDFDIKIMYSDEEQSPIVSVDMSHEQRFLGGSKNRKNENGVT